MPTQSSTQPPPTNVNNITTTYDDNKIIPEQWTSPYIFGSYIQQCSGHGTWIIPGLCQCDVGWTGRSDFINADGAQCHIHIWSLKAIWIFHCTMLVLVFLWSIPKISRLLVRFHKNQTKARTKGKTMSLWKDQKSLWCLLFFYAVSFPAQLVVGFMRIMADESSSSSSSDSPRIAFSSGISIAWFIARVGFYIPASQHQPDLIRQMLRAESATQGTVRFFAVICVFIYAIAIANAAFALPIGLEATNVPIWRTYFAIYVSMQCVVFFGANRLGVIIRTRLSSMLDTSYAASKNEDILVMKKSVVDAMTAVVTASGIQVGLYLILLCCPPLWICHDWFLPVSWLGLISMEKKILDSIDVWDNGPKHVTLMWKKQQPQPPHMNSKEIVVKGLRDYDSSDFVPMPKQKFNHSETQQSTVQRSSMWGGGNVILVDENAPELLEMTDGTYTSESGGISRTVSGELRSGGGGGGVGL